AGREELCKKRKYPTIFTPHPGEMARLLGSSISEVETRRIETAQEAADRYAAVVVLKGAHSIIASPEGRAWINLTGNPGMGTAGSGDVLSGIIGALTAAMPSAIPAEPLRLGVYLHGLAGDLAAEAIGATGITASDILNFIPEALRQYPKTITATPLYNKIHPV
ncbi:MAG: bifunctional ADP-dependent NAD(P)H-hydrate dehydratase/NAD(P)H-hydrate epimerase, partial [Spirochaetes bacterium]